jgi:hypothetical protein
LQCGLRPRNGGSHCLVGGAEGIRTAGLIRLKVRGAPSARAWLYRAV